MCQREESGSGRVVLSEAVLSVGQREGVEFRKNEAFENLYGRTENGNGAVARTFRRRFSRFEKRYDGGCFPDVRYSGCTVRKIEEMCQVCESERTEMLQVVDSEAIRTDGIRVSAAPNGLTYSERGEGTQLPVKRTPSIEAPLDLPGERVRGVRYYCGKLFIECGGY